MVCFSEKKRKNEVLLEVCFCNHDLGVDLAVAQVEPVTC